MKRALVCFWVLSLGLASCQGKQSGLSSIDRPVQASTSGSGRTKNGLKTENRRPGAFESLSAVSRVQITFPPTGSKADSRLTVEGVVEDPNAAVWVIVHPLEVQEYWVQQRVTVRSEDRHGSWVVRVYIGDSETPLGTRFEIRAIANPRKLLEAGKVLTDWPTARWVSNIVYVIKD